MVNICSRSRTLNREKNGVDEFKFDGVAQRGLETTQAYQSLRVRTGQELRSG